jgi:hypothetical protein
MFFISKEIKAHFLNVFKRRHLKSDSFYLFLTVI